MLGSLHRIPGRCRRMLVLSLLCAQTLLASATMATELAPTQALSDGKRTELARITESARSVRSALRRDISPDAIAELSKIADVALELPEDPRLGPLLVHLHHSALLIANPPIEGAPLPRLDSRPWLTRAIEVAGNDPGEAVLRAHARLELALLDEAAGNTKEALAGARAAAFEGAFTEHDDTLYRARWLIGRLHRAAGEEAAALSAYREAVATLENMKAEIVVRAQSDVLSFRREVEPVYRGLVDLLLTEAAQADEEEGQRLLHEARETIERSREAELRDYYQDECLVSPDKSRTDTIPGSVLIHPIRLDDRVEILVGRQGRLSRHSANVSPAELEALAGRFRRDLENRMTRRYVRTAEALHEALIRPVESRLAEIPVDALVFFPGELLRKIPIGALRDPKTKRFLIQDYPIAVAPSLALTDPQPLQLNETRLLAAGLTEGVQGFAPLPNVRREIEAVRGEFEGESFVDEDFRTPALEAAIQSVPYRVLHIASHAQFSSDPSKSFILTWDDRMPLAQLSDLLGASRFRADEPIDLLVLSACETAAGDDRSTLGLAGAAIQMGARSVVGSLWAVNDEASSRLMTHFYRELAKPGTSRAAALQAAQVFLLEQDAYAHPVDWAAFLLISNWL